MFRIFEGNPKVLFSLLFLIVSIMWFTGCSEENSIVSSEEISDNAALTKILDEDEDINSFEPGYNEEGAISFVLGKTSTQIYPIRVGQKVKLINRNLDINVVGDSATGKMVLTFTGTLFVAASYNEAAINDSSEIDTVIAKPFTSVITRNVQFSKKAHTKNPMNNWKIAAISLPEGGVLSENIKFTKMTIFLPGGDTLEITSPNDYYLHKSPGKKRQVPTFSKGESATVKLEVRSAYADTDFVTLTYGADKKGLHRSKRKFDLVSQTFDGQYYYKTYQQTYTTHQWVGHYHAIVNALPKQVIYDDATAVECTTWGIPYFVR